MTKTILTLLLLGLCYTLPSAADESAEQPAGRILFNKHGCTNCHGPEGIHPESKYAPVLKGKSAGFLFDRASSIVGDEAGAGKSRFMHEQFCVGEDPDVDDDEGCYPMPSMADLRTITEWLGSGSLPDKKKTPQGLYLSANEAHQMVEELGDKVLFLDVRSRSEIGFLGMPIDVDANIPYMTPGSFDEWDDKKQNFKLTPNSEFVRRVNELTSERGMDKETPIVMICRSGNRSAKAAKILDAVGYKQVYSIVDGFEGDKAKDGPNKGQRLVNGWKNVGLPWSYKLNKDAMYWDL